MSWEKINATYSVDWNTSNGFEYYLLSQLTVSFVVHPFDNCKVSLFFMVPTINIIISASNLAHLQLASHWLITSPYFG
ncbi:Uncharacterized protein APZ42_011708 [Daphnia magna]|uniref:Uncharacterized protein n=1 Tax=Daphnia magna TaxID=35525 RepID=A0A162SWU6_9CRUS|nr:Uncharacterized protein APZ42_011708 [Daphnia magna]